MPGTNGPNFGFNYGFTLGDDGWDGSYNGNFQALETTMFLSVLSVGANSPPGSPANGDRHIVGTAGSGAWSGHNNAVATYYGSSWVFLTPKNGWRAYSITTRREVRFNGTVWYPMVTVLHNIAITGTTSEVVAAYVNVPGGVLGPHGSVDCDILVTTAGISGTVTGVVRIDTGSPAGSDSGHAYYSNTFSANKSERVNFSVVNNNAENAQIVAPATLFESYGELNEAFPTSTVDTASDWTLSFNLHPSSSGDTTTVLRAEFKING